MDADNMAASVSILRTNLISLMPNKIVCVELIVWVPGNIYMVVIAGLHTYFVHTSHAEKNDKDGNDQYIVSCPPAFYWNQWSCVE